MLFLPEAPVTAANFRRNTFSLQYFSMKYRFFLCFLSPPERRYCRKISAKTSTRTSSHQAPNLYTILFFKFRWRIYHKFANHFLPSKLSHRSADRPFVVEYSRMMYLENTPTKFLFIQVVTFDRIDKKLAVCDILFTSDAARNYGVNG